MKVLLTLFILTLGTFGFAQDQVMKFQSSNMNLNFKGKNTKKNIGKPTVIAIDMETQLLTIETQSSEITQLFEGQMSRQISETMGKLGDEFSLTIDKNIFAHFYLDDRKMIMFTRNDIHPTKWGLMLTEVSAVVEEE